MTQKIRIPVNARGRVFHASWDGSESIKEALRLVRDYGFISWDHAEAYLDFVEDQQYQANARKMRAKENSIVRSHKEGKQ